MATLILDAQLEDSLRAARAESGADRFDEVWEGTYVMAPFPNDEHQEIDFYAHLGVREMLIVDRFPWTLELYRLERGAWRTVGSSAPGSNVEVTSAVLPLAFTLSPGAARPSLDVVHVDSQQSWRI